MRESQSHLDATASMARNGDPSAFYSLFADQSLQAYRSLRSCGLNHPEALESLLQLLAKSFRAFPLASPKVPPQEWYDQRLTALPEIGSTPEDILPREVTLEDLADFKSEAQKLLQRETGHRNREFAGPASIVHAWVILRRNLAAQIALLLAALIVASLGSGYVWLSRSGSRLNITLRTTNREYALELPRPGPTLPSTEQPQSGGPVEPLESGGDPFSPEISDSTRKRQQIGEGTKSTGSGVKRDRPLARSRQRAARPATSPPSVTKPKVRPTPPRIAPASSADRGASPSSSTPPVAPSESDVPDHTPKSDRQPPPSSPASGPSPDKTSAEESQPTGSEPASITAEE